MRGTQLLQETRKMHFEEILNLWAEDRLTQEEAARILSVSDRTFRRYINRFHEDGLDGLQMSDAEFGQQSAGVKHFYLLTTVNY
jgi:transposase